MVFVGDIHGCIDEFDSLLEKVRFDRQQDSLVLVGDLVNKGYDSISVVKRAMELGAHCVLGNHDVVLTNRYMVFTTEVSTRMSRRTVRTP
jgi:predicted MPP superfamily phosphohydrolase